MVYLGGEGALHVGRRARVLAVHRYRIPEPDVGPVTLTDVVIHNNANLKSLGGLQATDRLALAFLDDAGDWTNQVTHLVRARDVELVAATATRRPGELPANWDEIAASIARRCLGVDTLDERSTDRLDFYEVSVAGIRDALVAAYLAGATSADRAATEPGR